MSFTVQNLLDRARLPLNDAGKDRYPDSELLTYAQDAFLQVYRHRPDLFLGLYTSLPAWSSLSTTSVFPNVGDQYMAPIVDYITARAEFKDDEHVVAQRAQAMLAMFGAGLGAA